MISGLPGVLVLRRVYSCWGACCWWCSEVSRARADADSWASVRGGLAVGGARSSRLYRVSQGDEVDVGAAQYFANSSLAPVLLFRRRLKSVADVLKGIRQHGFSQARLDALHRYWAALCRQGPCGPVVSLEPWDGWIPPDLHGFFHWVLTSMGLLSRLLSRVGTPGCLGEGIG